MKPIRYAALLLIGAPMVSAAIDLGVKGRVYEIVEPDFRAVVGQQLARAVKPEELEKKKEKALDRYIAKLPNYGLGLRDKPVTKKVDVTQVLSRDIWAPELNAQGKIEHRLVGRKGQRIDPFSNGIIPNTAFLFIDGTIPDQVALAKAVNTWSPLVYIVLSKGDPRGLASEIDFPVDFIRPELIDMFDLRTVPSFVWVEKQQGTGVVQVFEMARPLAIADVKNKWNPTLTGSAGLKAYRETRNALIDESTPGSSPDRPR